MDKILACLDRLWPFPKWKTESAVNAFYFSGCVLIALGLAFYIFPILGYLLDEWGYVESIRPNSTFPTHAKPFFPHLIPLWIALIFLVPGICKIVLAKLLQKKLAEKSISNIPEVTDVKDEAKRKKRAYVFVAVYVLLTILYKAFPQYIPRIPFISSHSKTDQWIEQQINDWKKDAEMQELTGNQIESKEIKISFAQPLGWHVYIGEHKKHHGIVIRKDVTDATSRHLEDSPYMMLLDLGLTVNRPPGDEAPLVEKGLKEMFDGFKLEKNEIVALGDHNAIRMEGAFNKNGKTYNLGSYLIDLSGESYWLYYVTESWQASDRESMEKTLRGIRHLA